MDKVTNDLSKKIKTHSSSQTLRFNDLFNEVIQNIFCFAVQIPSRKHFNHFNFQIYRRICLVSKFWNGQAREAIRIVFREKIKDYLLKKGIDCPTIALFETERANFLALKRLAAMKEVFTEKTEEEKIAYFLCRCLQSENKALVPFFERQCWVKEKLGNDFFDYNGNEVVVFDKTTSENVFKSKLRSAVRSGNILKVKYLVETERGREMPTQDWDGGLEGLYELAAGDGYFVMVQYFHEKFIDRISLDATGSAIVASAKNNQLSMVKLLAVNERARQISNKWIYAAIECSAENNHPQVVKCLMEETPQGRQIPASEIAKVLLTCSSRGHYSVISYIILETDKWKQIPNKGIGGFGHIMLCAASNNFVEILVLFFKFFAMKNRKILINGTYGFGSIVTSAVVNGAVDTTCFLLGTSQRSLLPKTGKNSLPSILKKLKECQFIEDEEKNEMMEILSKFMK